MPLREYRLPSDSVELCLSRLEQLLQTVPAQLTSFPESTLSSPLAPGKWSRKQIIGHLIDSATNNHHRFVRGQFEDRPRIAYDQDAWNQFSYHQHMDGHALIDFWLAYNLHLLHMVREIPAELLEKECTMSDGSAWTIARLFEDYVRHMEHHLQQIFTS